MLRRILDMLTRAYRRDEGGNIAKLLSMYADTVKDAEYALETVRAWRDIDRARGSTLDRIGRTFGVERAAGSDAYFRLRIKVKIAVQLSSGTAGTILSVVSSLLGIDMGQMRTHELPGVCNVMINEAALTQEQIDLLVDIQRLAKGACAAGVSLRIYLSQLQRCYITVQMGIVTILYSKLEVSIA